MLSGVTWNRRRCLSFASASTAVLAVAVAACGGSTASSEAGALPGPLGPASGVVSQVASAVPGLSSRQVAQGMGGILGYAQAKLPPNQYSSIAGAFPGADAMVSEGTKLGMPSEATGLTSLRGTLGKAGISKEQFDQMIPAMTDLVNQKAGAESAQRFAGLFK